MLFMCTTYVEVPAIHITPANHHVCPKGRQPEAYSERYCYYAGCGGKYKSSRESKW